MNSITKVLNNNLPTGYWYYYLMSTYLKVK